MSDRLQLSAGSVGSEGSLLAERGLDHANAKLMAAMSLIDQAMNKLGAIGDLLPAGDLRDWFAAERLHISRQVDEIRRRAADLFAAEGIRSSSLH